MQNTTDLILPSKSILECSISNPINETLKYEVQFWSYFSMSARHTDFD